MFNFLDSKKKLLKKANVNGYAESDGELHVFVTKKLSMAELTKLIKDPSTPWEVKDVVPETYKGKKTKVIEIGEVKALIDNKKYRPIKGGCEIGPKEQKWAGTAGAVVYYSKYRNLPLIGRWNAFEGILHFFGILPEIKEGLLTNAHVVHFDVTKAKDPVIVTQPARSKTNIVGKSIYTIPMRKKGKNEFDVSIIELDEHIDADSEIIDLGFISHAKQVKRGDKVMKYGRTTKLMKGECKYTNVTINVNYGDWLLLTMTGLDMFTKMSAPGDSGSVILDDKYNAVSLLFAGNSNHTYGIPMPKIVDHLGIEF